MKKIKVLSIENEDYEIVDEKARNEITNLYVNNINELKALTDLKVGNVIKTLGYYEANDGGQGTYLIREKTELDREDNGSIHFIGDSLVAELIIEGSINVKQFGAKGDNVQDDQPYIQKALDFLPNGCKLEFPKTDSWYRIKSQLTLNDKSNVIMDGARISALLDDDTKLDPVLRLMDLDNVTIENCEFTNCRQTLLIYTANNLKISKCSFYETGYAVIQQMGYVSNNVIVTECYGYHLNNDMVECNCELNAPSKNWVVSNNIYDGLLREGAIEGNVLETRFLGSTYVDGLIVEGNVIQYASGTSGVHIEDPIGNVLITGNIFKNCTGYGCVSLHNPGNKNVLISNNIFQNTLEEFNGTMVYIYGTDDTPNINVSIEGNEFIGNGTQSEPIRWCDIIGYRGLIKNNTFKGINYLFDMTKYPFVFIDLIGNKINCNEIFKYKHDGVYKRVENINLISNIIKGNIELNYENNGGTAKKIVISDCFIDGNINIQNSEDIILRNNTLATGRTITFDTTGYYAKRMYAYNNFILGTGFNPSDNYLTQINTTQEGV